MPLAQQHRARRQINATSSGHFVDSKSSMTIAGRFHQIRPYANCHLELAVERAAPLVLVLVDRILELISVQWSTDYNERSVGLSLQEYQLFCADGDSGFR